MINAYKNFFKNFAEFTGRSTRPDYWWVWLGNLILSIPFWIIYFIFGLALLLPSLALMVRRLRDAGFHWALIFILFVPLGSIVLLVLFAMPTKETL